MNKRFIPKSFKIRNCLKQSLALFGLFVICSAERGFADILINADPFPNPNPYGISPFESWKTLETEHFQISFPAAFAIVAQRVANLYEEAYQDYRKLFQWQPRSKVLVVLLDNQDTANGLSSAALRFGMVLWLTPPDNWSTINFYDEWLRILVFHELAHFMSMDATHGFYDWARSIFLDWSVPNVLWPPWIHEGMAVYLETQYTSSGRGRSTDYEMLLRAAVHENRFQSREFMGLDLLNGNNPYYPGGDTRYQFGYHLMEQLAETKKNGNQPYGKEAMGRFAYESAHSVPFFLDETLTAATGRTWESVWDEWISSTQSRMQRDLAKITSQPVTQVRRLTKNSRERSNEVLGAAVSPDGKWLAYTLISADQRSGLYLMDLASQESRRISDKLMGVGLQFTPDSKVLIYSEFNSLDQFSGLSDLRVYDLVRDRIDVLSDRMRAKDPAISPDGKWITFTKTELSRTDLVRAPLVRDERGYYTLGVPEVLVQSSLYERVATPKFSQDGQKIFYSLHPNGKSQEDLIAYDLKARSKTVLWSDGFYNRFPAVDLQGRLYFVSNKTGVDNLYRYRGQGREPQMVTNLVTGLRLPTFGPKSGRVYFNYFSSVGWDLAETDLKDALSTSALQASQAKVAPPPAPQKSTDSIPKTQKIEYVVQDYSPMKSMLPRAIVPLGGIDTRGMTFGAQTFGFDQLDLHRYTLGASFSTQLQSADLFALYSNRTLGGGLSVSGSYLSSIVKDDGVNTWFNRSILLSLGYSYPIVRTYWQWIPSLAFNIQRTYGFIKGPSTDSNLDSQSDAIQFRAATPTVFSADTGIAFSSAETSRLALTTEGGRQTAFNLRHYLLPEGPLWKAFFEDQEYLRLAQHTILTPSLAGLWTSDVSSSAYAATNVLMQGRSTSSLWNSLSGNSVSQMSIRGYPNVLFFGRGAVRSALDLRLPLGRIFEGWGIQRVFVNQLYAIAFAEGSSVWPAAGSPVFLPAAGAGLRLSTELFYLPITWGAEWHSGLNSSFGGKNDFFLNVLVSSAF